MLVILLGLLSIVHGGRRLSEVEYKTEFASFVEKFNKEYENAIEWAGRYETFKDNLDEIYRHNNFNNSTFTKGVTQFSDQTAQEWIERKEGMGCLKSMKQSQRLRAMRGKTKKLGPASCTSVDWVAKGAVTPVKNQQQCGSCWAFSTTGSIEGRYFISKGQLNSLSEQQLVDCAGSEGNAGCNGGLMDNAFQYVESAGGLCSETEYPYVAKKQYFHCGTVSSCTKNDPISSFTDVTPKSRSELEAAVCEGPVSIAIEADQDSFQQYTGGVLTSGCGKQLDHGVLIVGLGTSSDGIDYWKVKNSWGPTWGENGYIRIARDAAANGGSGVCGILGQPSYPDV